MVLKKIVMTRPLEQGQLFAERICDSDSRILPSDFLFEPLLKIRPQGAKLPDVEGYDGIILTSTHGLAALSDRALRAKPFYCVGESLNAQLQEKGVANIPLTAPSGADLAKEIAEFYPEKKMRFLYVRGRDVAFDMKGVLEYVEHQIDEIICYEAISAFKFSDEFMSALKCKNIFAVTFFSKRAAETFVKIAYESGIFDDLKGIKALCISQSVLECLHTVFDKNIEVSDSPNAHGMSRLVQCSLLGLLESAAGENHSI